MTFGEAEAWYCDHLARLYDRDEAKTIFSVVVRHFFGMTRSRLLTAKSELVPAEQEQRLRDVFHDLSTGKPIQYITGETEFCGLRFLVGPEVLIPRPETEELAMLICGEIDAQGKTIRVLDIGTGSGCIAVTIAKKTTAEVWALDVSATALEIACKNAAVNAVVVTFVQADILQLVQLSGGPVDIIVSNPPYIPAAEAETMHKNVVEFEPHLALFVEDDDPILFYKAIAGFAVKNLSAGGRLYFEVHEDRGEEVVRFLKSNGFREVELIADLNGKSRMIGGTVGG